MNGFPSFYRPDQVGTLFYPNLAAVAAEAEATGLPPASQDRVRRLLLLVDMQVDFCHPNGALYVPGAEGDIRRVVEFLFRNAGAITRVACSLDAHYPCQIFHPAWWRDRDGRAPAPFTVISAEEVRRGRWKPVRDAEWSVRYVETLEHQAKKQLVIWPYHTLIGSVGHALDPTLAQAVLWHALARGYQPVFWTKGSVPRTEHYSILRPEVPVEEDSRGGLARGLVEELERFDQIIVAGEAETHCVLETLEDLVELWGGSPEKLGRVFVLRDGTSPVVHPEVDFHAIAQRRFERFAQQGMNFILTTDRLLGGVGGGGGAAGT